MEASSRAETLPKNLIAHLSVQDPNGRGFGSLLFWTSVHAVSRIGKTRGRRSKRNFVRESEGTHAFQIWSVSWYSLESEPPTEALLVEDMDTWQACTHMADTYPTQLVHQAKNLVFDKMSFKLDSGYTTHACDARRGVARRASRGMRGVHVDFFSSHSLWSTRRSHLINHSYSLPTSNVGIIFSPQPAPNVYHRNGP
jgi:hypothetical protein